MLQTLKNSKTKIIWILVGALVVSIVGILSEFPKKWIWPEPITSIPENRIDVKMEIQSIKGDTVFYYFQVTNKLNSDIIIHSKGILSPNQSEFEIFQQPIPLRKGNSIDLYPISSIISVGSDMLNTDAYSFKTSLLISYYDENDNINKIKKNVFEFSIPKNLISHKQYSPTRFLQDTLSSDLLIMKIEAQKQIAQSEGSVYFVISFGNDIKHEISPILSTYNFGIFYDNRLNRILLYRLLQDQKVINLDLTIPPKAKDLYILAIVWSDSSTMISIDNVEKTARH